MQIKLNKKGDYQITLFLKKLPKHCGECPLYKANKTYDEDSWFGDGYSNDCPFLIDTYGCLVERPKNCPIKKVGSDVKSNQY